MTDKPDSLPLVVKPSKAAKKTPKHLPTAATAPARFRENVIPNARKCSKCGKVGRVVSNFEGINVFCSCGYHWPISSSPLSPAAPLMPDRGFSKHTLIEPDWNKAFDDQGGMANESFGPPPKRGR